MGGRGSGVAEEGGEGGLECADGEEGTRGRGREGLRGAWGDGGWEQ